MMMGGAVDLNISVTISNNQHARWHAMRKEVMRAYNTRTHHSAGMQLIIDLLGATTSKRCSSCPPNYQPNPVIIIS